MAKIPYSKQSIDAADIQSVVDVLNGPLITQGPHITRFEQSFAEYCGSKYAVAVSSGTSALIIANQALGLKCGDSVITTPNTFVATANSIALSGGVPTLVDIDSIGFNISIHEIQLLLQSEQKFRGIIPVHFAGLPADMESISRLANRNGLYVIEDACHALGGSWVDSKGIGHRIGDCSHSDITIFSFHPVKHITTGEGGMITTNDISLYERLLSLRTHGISKPDDIQAAKAQPWLYEMHHLSSNYRITDIQCALGLSQLKKNAEWCRRRTELVKQYDAVFQDSSNISPQHHPDSDLPSYHLYVIQAENRDGLYKHLHAQQILAQVHYIPVHYHPYYQEQFRYQVGDFPTCEEFYSKALSLPLYPSLTDVDQNKVISAVQEFYHAC